MRGSTTCTDETSREYLIIAPHGDSLTHAWRSLKPLMLMQNSCDEKYQIKITITNLRRREVNLGRNLKDTAVCVIGLKNEIMDGPLQYKRQKNGEESSQKSFAQLTQQCQLDSASCPRTMEYRVRNLSKVRACWC